MRWSSASGAHPHESEALHVPARPHAGGGPRHGRLCPPESAPQSEPRTVIGVGPRVLFEDDLRAAHNWSAAHGTICKSSYADGGFVVENIAASAPCLLGPVRAEAFPSSVRIEVSARQRKGT